MPEQEWLATVEVITDEEVSLFLDNFLENLADSIPWKGIIMPQIRDDPPRVRLAFGLEAESPLQAKSYSETYITNFLGEYGMRWSGVNCIAVENAADPDDLHSYLAG